MLKRGVTANLNEQLITSGSQQGLDLVIRSFIKEGDVLEYLIKAHHPKWWILSVG